MIDRDKIMGALGRVEDPELRRPLTDLGMIKDVLIEGNDVKIHVNLTIPGCPLKKKIADDVKAAVGQIDGVENVEIEFGAMTAEERKRIRERMYGTEQAAESSGEGSGAAAGEFAGRVIAVASGKGGVGKSTVTANLAIALDRLGYKVGVLDADVYGFSMPRILGIEGQPTIIDDQLVPLRRDNIQVISMGFFITEDQPVIWRGPLLHKTITQFISDVLWDKLDYFLIDLPPGTGDVTITISQALPKAELLVITTPQPVASHTAGRVARMAEKTDLKVLGVIENMSFYESNGQRDYIFGKGGGRDLAGELGVPLLGEIPIKTAIRIAADNGKPEDLLKDSAVSAYYRDIARSIAEKEAVQ